MRKPELISEMAERLNLPKKQVGELLNIILDQVALAVSREESVNLTGFGAFCIRERQAREGKNPQTGEKLFIPATKTVAFKPSQTLKSNLSQL